MCSCDFALERYVCWWLLRCSLLFSENLEDYTTKSFVLDRQSALEIQKDCVSSDLVEAAGNALAIRGD